MEESITVLTLFHHYKMAYKVPQGKVNKVVVWSIGTCISGEETNRKVLCSFLAYL